MLVIDGDRFRAAFGRAAFPVRHTLLDHPLLGLPALVDLARVLPTGSIEFNAGDLPVSLAGASPRTGLSAAETIRGIEHHRSWMVLQNVEQQADYRALLLACLEDIRPLSDPLRPGLSQPEAFIFISSPGAVTPYHMDPEHGFLLQLHGQKVVTIFDGSHPDVLGPPALEAFHSGASHRNMTLPETARGHARAWTLGPGDGVHIPVTFPHFVEVDRGSYSISLSVTFRTPDLRRRAHAHYFNAFLRRRGVRPAALGQSPTRDRAKAAAGQLLAAGRRALTRARVRSSPR